MSLWEPMDAMLMENLAKVRQHSPVMFSPFGAIIAVMSITYLAKMISALLLVATTGGYDNANPRDQVVPKGCAASRALAAHNNGFEALIMFTAAVFMGVEAGIAKKPFEELCTLFVFVRLAFTFVYVFLSFNSVLSLIRSAVFTVGVVAVAKIMLMATDAKFGYIAKFK